MSSTGESQKSLVMQFKISRNLVCAIIPEVCRAIYEVLRPTYLKMPTTEDAFPLKPYLMKPYPGRNQTNEERIFNYRLSSARRTFENAFGIMSAQFQVFRTPIRTSADIAKDITLAAEVLHNYSRSTSRESYAPPNIIDTENFSRGEIQEGRWRQHPHGGIERLPVVIRGHCTEAKQVRDNLKSYFNREGLVHW